MAQERYRQLDSLRGLAALIVVFNHYAQVVPESIRLATSPSDLLSFEAWASPWTWLRFSPLRLLINGQAAVDIFFVLSGFVLALQVTKASQPASVPFLLKRFCRVYLPFCGAILLAAAAFHRLPVDPVSGTSDWIHGLLVELRTYSLAEHLLLTGQPTGLALNPVVWTLIHEMRVSVVLPLLFLAVRTWGALKTVGGCLLISLAASVGMADSISGSLSATLHFLWMFAAGVALSFNRHRVAAWLQARTVGWTFSLSLAALALLIVPLDRVRADFFIGGGASLVVSLTVSKNALTKLLASAVPLWLGRVSYSLYLIHLPLLMLGVAAGMTPGGLMVLFLVTLALSEVMYRTLEAPAHALGVWLSKRIQAAARERPPAAVCH